jgi:hypothetical protein
MDHSTIYLGQELYRLFVQSQVLPGRCLHGNTGPFTGPGTTGYKCSKSTSLFMLFVWPYLQVTALLGTNVQKS